MTTDLTLKLICELDKEKIAEIHWPLVGEQALLASHLPSKDQNLHGRDQEHCVVLEWSSQTLKAISSMWQVLF